MIVSRTVIPRFMRSISVLAATSRLSRTPYSLPRSPSMRTLAPTSQEPLDASSAPAKSPASARRRISSITRPSLFRRSATQKSVRSMMRVTAQMEQRRRGHMRGPPFEKSVTISPPHCHACFPAGSYRRSDPDVAGYSFRPEPPYLLVVPVEEVVHPGKNRDPPAQLVGRGKVDEGIPAQ